MRRSFGLFDVIQAGNDYRLSSAQRISWLRGFLAVQQFSIFLQFFVFFCFLQVHLLPHCLVHLDVLESTALCCYRPLVKVLLLFLGS